MSESKQLPLFKLEGNLTPRDVVRKVSKTADYMRKVDLSIVVIGHGVNARIKPSDMSEEMWNMELKIPELADGLFVSNGPDEPLLGDFYKEDNRFYVNNGERRTRAMRYLIATGRTVYPNGNPVNEVYVVQNPPGTTDLDRKRKVITTDNNLKLTPMQKAFYYLSFKTDNGMNSTQIAEFFNNNISRQTIDNYFLATELPKEIRDKIDTGEVKISNAIKEFRKERKIVMMDENSGEILDEETARLELLKKEKEKEKYQSGDEDEFEQQDNSVNFAGSMSGAKEPGSAAVTIPTDSIYKEQQHVATWKQFINRYEVLKQTVTAALLKDDVNVLETTGGNLDGWINDRLVERLRNEYTPPKAK